MQENKRVLSIQSHTVSSYCGNKSAVFPLQTLGFDVDALNTVQFSNHTAYPKVSGSKLTAEDVQQLFQGLEANGLMNHYTHVLTGYIGNFLILEIIEKMVKKLKENNPELIYVCDTVMGDHGTLYVSPEIVPLYQHIIQYADVITPNQFEAETLANMKIETLEDVCKVAERLHQMGSQNVVITSLNLPLKEVPEELQTELSSNDSLYCFTSQRLVDNRIEQHLISFPTYPGRFTGTGDLFASLVVARIQEHVKLVDAVYKVVCSVNQIAKSTYIYQKKHLKKDMTPAQISRICELRLIQGKRAIEEPSSCVNDKELKVVNVSNHIE